MIQYEKLQQWNRELIEEQQQQALHRFAERTPEREDNEASLQTHSPFEVDQPDRVANRKKKLARNQLAMERIIGENDLFPISYFQAGINASKSVCRIEIRDGIGKVVGHGTGFMVTPNLLLTNHHILKDEEVASQSLAQFNFEQDVNLREKEIKNFHFKPEQFFLSNQKLDFALVAVETTSSDGNELTEFGHIPLQEETGKALIGERVSIIQHASGRPKAVSIRENKVQDVLDNFIHYSTDTMPGSSGSPVFNDEWEVVSLHHAGVPDPNDNSSFVANEGVRISRIISYIKQQQNSLSSEQRKLLGNLLDGEQPEAETDQDVVVEEKSVDSYKDREGYNASFLGEGHSVPLPTLREDLQQDVAPMKDGGTVLHYTHFSVVMSKSRKLAYYTVVNINGKQLKSVDRADRWYLDPRMDKQYQAGQDLYYDNPLDRGHLVRRIDPIWGDKAEVANEDTFHFTNCAPQHKDLNQQSWLDLENYIVENARNHDMKATVFTGPVFRSDDMVYRDIQIPNDFWKIAVMVKEDGTLSATAYLQTQKNLVGNLEFAYGDYKTYQVPVSKVEELTGLDFGPLRKHDPIQNLESTIGHIIEQKEDITL
ncbi:DNA/RNA non-specific endonuclease [Pontibacillus salicampi]|uniref:DNA/RNA non-specific endonuclease n=1 Tax=Pontibacillus salicampi TaxID=1449801 RepID=A0ABV6LPP3_9BACI